MSATPAATACCATRFTLKVRLLEDLHAGSGLGGAGIDALLARDRLGRPVVRWSHVKGLLIEALRGRCKALGEDADASVERLFGKGDERGTIRGIVRGRSLRVAGGGAAFDDAIVWSSTARAQGTRVPLDDTLRRIEFVRAGTTFRGEVRMPGKIGDDDTNLVAKLIRRLARLGGERSRGAGLVHIEFEPDELPVPRLAEPLGRTEGQAQAVCELRVVFRALEPLCLAATGQPRNLIASHSHLAPGTVAGMLARWAREHGSNALAEALMEGRIVCGPGYPLPLEGSIDPARVDSVPLPLSLQSPKPAGQTSALPWWASALRPRDSEDVLSRDEGARHGEKLKRPGAHDYLVTTDGEQWQLFVCPMEVALRNDAGSSQRNRAKQNLFSVEEIAEDTGFVVRLHTGPGDAVALESMLQALQANGHWLQAGRGGAPLAVAAYARLDGASRNASQSTVNDAGFRIFVESDLILRATDLRFHARLDRAAVLRLLAAAGVDDKFVGSLDGKVEQVSEPFAVRGWNIATRHQRIPAIGIRRGSVAVLKFSDPGAARACREALAERGRWGLGERAAEGYGRIRVDFAPAPAGQVRQAERKPEENWPEAVLRNVEDLLHGAMPDFPPSLWQSLRNAAADVALLNAWLDLARRRIDKTAEEKERKVLKAWLDRLKQYENRTEILRALGLAAAKRANRRERQGPHREEQARER